MSVWVGFGIWVVGFVLTYVVIMWSWITRYGNDGNTFLVGWYMALCWGFVWPIVVPLGLIIVLVSCDRHMSLRAHIERYLSPGLSSCHRCKRPWRHTRRHLGVVEHTTWYVEGYGCLPLCEGCWRALKTPEARLPYYRELWDQWGRQGGTEGRSWDDIEAAVYAGR